MNNVLSILKWVCTFPLSIMFSEQVLAQNVTDLTNKIGAYVQEITKTEQFQGAILVAKNDAIIYQKPIGFSNKESNQLNTIDTPFRIGSLTKSFTAITAMQFVEEGLLDLHSPIGIYLPKLDSRLGDKLNLHQLLKMQSGLPNHLARLTTLEYRDVSKEELVEIINTATLSFKPGSSYEYSNINYTLVALILEEVSGISFPEILSERIFDPLQMTRSGVERTNDQIPMMALGYRKSDTGVLQYADRNYMAYAIGSGDIYSTISDLYLWDKALENNSILSDSSIALLYTSNQPEHLGHYGYGFRVHEYVRTSKDGLKGKLIRHGGSMQGYLSNYHKYLDDDLTIIVLGNLRPYAVMDITTGIKEIVFNREPKTRSEMDYRY